jgi:DNA-binding transcriptional LysR family regulator
MDRLDELVVFVAVLGSGSLVGAARRLRRAPPSVTRALSALELRLGARLIERTTRKLTPTEIGGRVATDGRRALAAYAEAIRPGAEFSPRGLLRITAPLIFGRRHVTPVVASFLDLHPAMQAELVFADRYLDLLDEGLDVALRIGPPVESLPPPHRLGEVRRIVVAAPAYLAARGIPHEPAELARHAVVHAVGTAASIRVALSRRPPRESGPAQPAADGQRDRGRAGRRAGRPRHHARGVLPGRR